MFPKKAFRQARKGMRTSLEDCPVAFSAHFSASSCPVLLAFLCPQGQCVSGMFLALPGCTEEDSNSVGISNSCGPNASGFP